MEAAFTAAALAAQLDGRGFSLQDTASRSYLSFANCLCAAPLLTSSAVLYLHAADGQHHLFSESGRYVTVGVSPADGAAITCARPTAGAADAVEFAAADPASDAAGNRLVHLTLGGFYVMVRGTSALLSRKPVAASTFRVVVHAAAHATGEAAAPGGAAGAASVTAPDADPAAGPLSPLVAAAAFAVSPPAAVAALASVMSLAQAQPPTTWRWMQARASAPADGTAASAFEVLPAAASSTSGSSTSGSSTSGSSTSGPAHLPVTLRHGARVAIESADHPAIGASGRAKVVSAFQRVDERGVQLRLEPSLADPGCMFTVVRPSGDDHRFALWSPYGHFISATTLTFDPGLTPDDLAAAAGQAARDERRRVAATKTGGAGMAGASGAASAASPYRPSPSAGTAAASGGSGTDAAVDDAGAAAGGSRFASPAASAGGHASGGSSPAPTAAAAAAARGPFTTPVGRRLVDSLGGHATPATPQSPLAAGDDVAPPLPPTPYPPAVRSAAVASFPPLPQGSYLRFFPARRPLTVCDLFELVPVPSAPGTPSAAADAAAASGAPASVPVERRHVGGTSIDRLSGVAIRCCGVGGAPAPPAGSAWAVGPDSLIKDNMYAHGVLHAPLPPLPPASAPLAASGAAGAAAGDDDGAIGGAAEVLPGHPLFTFHIYDCGLADNTELQRAVAVARVSAAPMATAAGTPHTPIPVRSDPGAPDAYEVALREGVPLGCSRPALTAIDDNSGAQRLALPPVARAWAVAASVLEGADGDSDSAAAGELMASMHGLSISDGPVRPARLLDGSPAPADGVTPADCTALQPTPSLGAGHISMMSYNILADSMARLSPDEHCHPHFNQWQAYRWPHIAADIQALSPTIVCLQEVDPSAYERDIRPFMEGLGYEGLLVEESGPAFGRDLMKQATFWLTSHYRLVENRSIFTRKLFENAGNMSGIEGRPVFGPNAATWTREERDIAWAHLAFWRRMKGTGKSVAITALAPVGRHRGAIHPLVVANVHLLASKERAEQRALQAAVIVKYCRYAASKLGEAVGAPAALVMCGDFNSGTALRRPERPAQLEPFAHAVAETGELSASATDLATSAMHAAACIATFQPRSLQLLTVADSDDDESPAVTAAASTAAASTAAASTAAASTAAPAWLSSVVAASADAIAAATTAAFASGRCSAGVYALMRHGYLGRHHPHHPFQFYQQCARLGLGESSFAALHSSTVLSFQLPFAFTSAYSAVCGVEAPWTNMHAHHKHSLDYIFVASRETYRHSPSSASTLSFELHKAHKDCSVMAAAAADAAAGSPLPLGAAFLGADGSLHRPIAAADGSAGAAASIGDAETSDAIAEFEAAAKGSDAAVWRPCAAQLVPVATLLVPSDATVAAAVAAPHDSDWHPSPLPALPNSRCGSDHIPIVAVFKCETFAHDAKHASSGSSSRGRGSGRGGGRGSGHRGQTRGSSAYRF